MALLGEKALPHPLGGATDNVVDILPTANALQVFGGLRAAAAGTADEIDRLGRVDLVRESGEVAQWQIHRTLRVDLGELVNLADIDQLCIVGDFFNGYFFHVRQVYANAGLSHRFNLVPIPFFTALRYTSVAHATSSTGIPPAE
ncbi:hypothetical protein CCYS_12140 [Corynebacterium cystitidis DSM 20524]|uniref:Uncharacterized protein n=1 Tax=Corynebacterium cystitidis DSM 20524 TaxID=1121357 RepID=A0A1H9V6Q7_9CORY|nr:hypothetical protein CCYS_12140 [Corynebacterium cystitidis DSM 20524]SES17362.1 hypothetical protein SAMN05661109_02099 [Corynebacterium cystitidis DSM 20524]SNV63415.1 Uncharacterised protein [Corynebacterium cystitidis]